jgi:hypothetical protein
VTGLDAEAVSKAVLAMRGRVLTPTSAYGDGRSAERIIRIAVESIGVRKPAVVNF